jgi:hypothetical protein
MDVGLVLLVTVFRLYDTMSRGIERSVAHGRTVVQSRSDDNPLGDNEH